MSKTRDALKNFVLRFRKKITIGAVGLLVAILAFPQVQTLFRSYRETVLSLGYQWNAESLKQAIQAEDSKAVKAFVKGEFRIPERIVWLVMEGKSSPGFQTRDDRPFGENIVRILSESRNIEPSACESLLARTQLTQPAWVGWVSEKPEYKRFLGAVCDTSAAPYTRVRQTYRENYDRQAAKMSDLVALGHCQPSQEVVFSCVHFYALLPRALSEARSKLEMIYRLDCAISSDQAACARKDGKWELPPPNPATSARANAVQNQCVSELKQRYSCPAFLEYASQAPSILNSNDPEHDTLDQPIEMAVALAQARLISAQAGGGNICQIYEEAIQQGCEQASLASISDPPSAVD